MKYWTSMDSPLGPLQIVVDPNGILKNLDFAATRAKNQPPIQDAIRDEQRCTHVVRQLQEYFEGTRKEFELEVAPEGTEFQREVWQVLLTISYGQTITYGEQARRMGRPAASRAVGAANGANPISIVIPCHRVIGSSGHLTGYASGVERKKWLLEHEGAIPESLAF